jgi:AraC family transcriptional regulator
MIDRPGCYPDPPAALLENGSSARLPLLDVLTSPVPAGEFVSPRDTRHVLCLHVGEPVPVSYRVGHRERRGNRIHGQFCVVPASTSTRWIVSRPARSLLLRLAPSVMAETTESMGKGARGSDVAPAIHVRDPQIERIGWMMQAEDRDGYPSGRLFIDSLASALGARLVSLQFQGGPPDDARGRALPAWRLRKVIDYIEAHLHEDLGLLELASVAGFSLSHFKPLFKQAVGMPVHRFVIERRVERARMLLVEGSRSVTEIALEAGFTHPSHMARWMRRVLGVSPSQIARNARGR